MKGKILDEYSSSDFIRTYTELVWSTQNPSLPLGFDGVSRSQILASEKLSQSSLIKYLLDVTEEDAVKAWQLVIPFIDDKTFIYEYGCWNGGNLLGLLFFGFEKEGIYPGGCIGTDINFSALNVAETASYMLSLHPPLLQFHLSNALHPHIVDISQFRCQKQIKMALRLLSVLEPRDAKEFLIQIKRDMTQKCFLIVSYAIPQGNRYEKNKELASSEKHLKENTFEYGVVFRAPFDDPLRFSGFVEMPDRTDQIINCYYTEKGFETLAYHCGYKIVNQEIVGKNSDNSRAVAILKI